MQNTTRFHIFHDSGAPEGSTDYTTVVILHGLGWHSGVFTKLIPLAHAHNARLVLVNRRDYPGAAPYTLAERANLFIAADESMTNAAAACPKVVSIMKEGAIDIASLLIRFLSDNRVPLPRPQANSGGIVLVGWSLGTAWLTALLARVVPSPTDAVNLPEYMRRIVFFDPPHLILGFPPPDGAYLPFVDPSIPPEGLVEAFNIWVTGVVQHNGVTKDTLDLEKPPASLPSTFKTLSAEERHSVLDPVPVDPRGGSDTTLMNAGVFSGAFALLREEALRVHAAGDGLRGWDAIAVRHVWCDASPWPMPWAATCLQEDIAGKRKAEGRVRDLTFTHLRGANHLVHWVEPERVLEAFLE